MTPVFTKNRDHSECFDTLHTRRLQGTTKKQQENNLDRADQFCSLQGEHFYALPKGLCLTKEVVQGLPLYITEVGWPS